MALSLTVGCETASFIDPTEMGRYKKDPLVLPILESLETGIEEPVVEFADASDIRPEDLIASSADYVIGKNDLVQISITDLVGPGVETLKTTRVSESGYITLPLVGQIQAAGQTEAQLEQTIVEAYRNANLIQNAQVSVTVAEARARTFSVLGNVNSPGQYAIVQSDFRLLDAMILFRDVGAFSDYVFIIRRAPAATATTQQAVHGADEATTEPADGQTGDDLIAPRSESPAPAPEAPAPTAAPVDATEAPPSTGVASEGEGKYVIIDGRPVLVAPDSASPTVIEETEGLTTGPGGVSPDSNKPFEFGYLEEPDDKRVIRVPVEPLKNGELKYNVVIRPNDIIVVPAPVTGEYYMGGHVGRVGVYSLTGRKITLKQAIVSAGMLDDLALPYRTDVIRRVGPNKEIWARVDLDAIFNGRQPDLYLKPNDIVQVGTGLGARFLSALRNGLRTTYGFGFVYDVNLSPDD